MRQLPDSARFACWANAYLAGAASLDDAGDAIRAGDAAHVVSGLPADGDSTPLLLALGRLRRLGTRRCHLALPRPGDPLGLAGPLPFTTAAVAAGEAVVCAGSGIGLVPGRVGAAVEWRALPAEVAAPPAPAEAHAELLACLSRCVDVVGELATVGPAPPPDLGDVTRAGVALAAGYPARSEQIAARALGTLSAVAAARAPGASVSGVTAGSSHELDRALRELDHAARAALVAVCSAPPAG